MTFFFLENVIKKKKNVLWRRNIQPALANTHGKVQTKRVRTGNVFLRCLGHLEMVLEMFGAGLRTDTAIYCSALT